MSQFHRSELQTPSPWWRLAAPVAAVLAALILIGLATVHWDAWIGSRAEQSTNDVYIRAQTTRLSSRVAGAVLAVHANDL